MDDIYMLSDLRIIQKIGEKLKYMRLKQNITQEDLAKESNVSVSTIKKIESGEIGRFDSFIRVLRILGGLDTLEPLIEQAQLSPSEYYDLVNSSKKKIRKRAIAKNIKPKGEEDSTW